MSYPPDFIPDWRDEMAAEGPAEPTPKKPRRPKLTRAQMLALRELAFCEACNDEWPPRVRGVLRRAVQTLDALTRRPPPGA